VKVRALLPNPGERLRPGMLMNVRILANPRQALAVPETAILDRADGAYVYRVAAAPGGGGEAAELVRIRDGVRANGMVEVLEGLSAGDRVVVEGIQNVRPGQPVRIQAPPAASGDQLRGSAGGAAANGGAR